MRRPWTWLRAAARAPGRPEEATSCADMSQLLIEKRTGRAAGNYGLAPKKWLAQLEEIRNLPAGDA